MGAGGKSRGGFHWQSVREDLTKYDSNEEYLILMNFLREYFGLGC